MTCGTMSVTWHVWRSAPKWQLKKNMTIGDPFFTVAPRGASKPVFPEGEGAHELLELCHGDGAVGVELVAGGRLVALEQLPHVGRHLKLVHRVGEHAGIAVKQHHN